MRDIHLHIKKGRWPSGMVAAALVMAMLALPFFSFAAVRRATSFANGAAGPAERTYTVRLKDDVSPRALAAAGTGVEHLFAFSSADAFQNIYRFKSVLTKPQLSAALGDDYFYLDEDRPVEGQVVQVNDPGFTTNTADVDKEWGLAKSGFPQVWEKSVGDKKNVVALIDTGMDATHQDLQALNVVDGYDFINNKALQGRANSDDNGHGTLIAGVLGATANNGKGIIGTNWFLSVMPIKALDSSGKGDSSSIAQAIVWAADHGADFINLSLGGIGFGRDAALSNAIAYAFNKNIVIVAAAGNDVATTGGNLDDEPVFPVCDDNDRNMIIGVAAVDQNDLKPQFSNFGKGCVDVSAPGKRILSTINYDPVTKMYAPNSYAYASGTSLAVPFVVGEAAIIRSLYPDASNTEIRDRIISSADNIDSLNLTQCGGGPCAGLLGSGRINAVKAVAADLAASLNEGDVVRAAGTGEVYQISGGQKRPVSTFVYNQRFLNASIKVVQPAALNSYPLGPYAAPLEGTLVKINSDSAVYQISKGLKLPITAQVFLQRNMSFVNVQTVSYTELASWVSGTFLPPLDGTLIKTASNPTVYWTVGGVLHPVNYAFFIERGLNIFPIITISPGDLAGFAKGEAYVS